jgi:hypothetical protein
MKPWQVDWSAPWFNGSDKVFEALRPGSTITQWRALSEAFSLQPTSLWIDENDRIGHNGRRDGLLEWHTLRPLQVRLVARLPIG